MRLSLGLGLPAGGGGAAFSPLSLAPFAWYDPSDLTTLFQDSAMTTPVTADDDPVGAMLDKSGNGHHLTQATAGARPLYKTSGGLHWLEFDGTDDTIAITYGAALDQPHERVSAWRSLESPGGRLSGSPDNEGIIYFRDPGGGVRISIFSGGNEISGDLAPAQDVDFVVTDRHNGAGSRVALDSESYTTGDAGSNAAGGEEFATFSADFTALRFYGSVRFDRLLTDPEIALLRTYLAAKQGRVL